MKCFGSALSETFHTNLGKPKSTEIFLPNVFRKRQLKDFKRIVHLRRECRFGVAAGSSPDEFRHKHTNA